MNFENFFRGFITTLIGASLMVLSVYEWYVGEETDWWQIGLAFVAGFALLWIRDKVSEFVAELFKRLLNKFFPS